LCNDDREKMKAAARYQALFGSMTQLDTPVSWTMGVSNVVEWMTWGTAAVLGVTKTRYAEVVVELCNDPACRDLPLAEQQAFVKRRIDALVASSERYERFAKPSHSLASPMEALRRAKFFSEDYLNKEFDIFWGLVDDRYLDRYYQQFFSFEPGGEWFCHGNGGLFERSTEIRAMAMDNLSYNRRANLLVANELKLGGTKNRDQILKYALMYLQLVDRGFIAPGTRFALLFLGDTGKDQDWRALIQAEAAYCRASKKSTLKEACNDRCLEVAEGTFFAATTWQELFRFNEAYLEQLEGRQQVERRLICGFNEALQKRAFLRLGATEIETAALA
jgi:hypothetical protein